MGIYTNAQKLINETVKNLDEYRTLIGKTTGKAGENEPGLNMMSEANTLKDYEESLAKGIFQVMFTGGFSAGKSVLINALMFKHLLRSSANAETAVLTKIIFNASEKVIVYKKTINQSTGAAITEEYTDTDKFFEKYRVDQDRPDLFDDVDHVVIQQSQDGIGGSLVQLIDSPGVGNSKQDDEVARSFAKKANAIVYVVSAAKPWEYDDKEYINSHYDNKEMKNVFFVVNKIDLLNTTDDFEKLKKNTRTVLRNVFTRNDGTFDEELFNERVFYMCAQNALLLRAGIPSNYINTPPLPQSDEETGVPRFEKALGRFLMDENRDKQAIAAYIPNLAAIYVSAQNRVEKNLEQLNGNIDDLLAEQKQNEKSIERTMLIIQNIEESGKTTARKIVEDINRAYDDFIKDVDVNWDEYFEKSNVNFSTIDLIKTATTRDEEKKKERIKPITDAVTLYLKSKEDDLKIGINDAVKTGLQEWRMQIQQYKQQLEDINSPISLDHIFGRIINSEPVNTGDADISVNMFQLILGIIAGDLDVIVRSADGTTSNTDALIKAVMNTVFEFIAIYVIAWPIGLAMLAKRGWDIIKSVRNGGNTSAVNMIKKMRESTIKGMKESKSTAMMDVEKNIGGSIISACHSIANTYEAECESYRKNLEDTIKKLEDSSFDRETEAKRTSNILSKMAQIISNISIMTTGKAVKPEEIETLTGRNA